ncbi:hypothetical protein BKA69DRAFT_853549 [Paraphysoderma sedebokerense]|nr:hypothetical protein BKA69DRAFT_853549 [Paraphysoderma sedebokerense]
MCDDCLINPLSFLAIVLGHLTHCLRPFQYSNDSVAKFGTLFSLSSQLIPPVVNDKTEQKEDAHANVGVLNEEEVVRSLEVTDPVTVVTVADVRAHVKFVEKHVQAEELDFEYLAAAERRYLKWLAMLFDHLATGKDILCLVPPADVKLMMYTHMLLPDKYRNDMESIFGSHYSQLLFNYSFPLTDAAASSEEWESSTGESTLQSQQPVSVPCYSCGTVQMINLQKYVNLRFGAEVVVCGGCGSSIHSANAAPNFSFDLVKTYCGLRKALIELAQTTDPLSDEQLAYAVFGYIGPNSTYYSGESGLFVKATHMLKPASYMAFYQGNISPFSDLIENVPVVLSDSRKAEVDLPETRNRNASISSSELRFESDVESVSSEVEQEKKLLTAESVINHLKLLEVLLDKDYGNDIPALIRSEARYLKWLTYIHGTKDWCAVPPADVALVAHIHTLRPVTFQKDLERLFGEASAHVISQHSLLNCPVEDFTVEVDTQSEYGFENYTGEPYFFNPASTALETEYLIACPSCVSIRSITQKEMVQLKLRQQPFVCSVCEVESTLEELRKRNRGVDPLDLDLISEITIWRSKMTAYVGKLKTMLDDATVVESLVASYHNVVDDSVEKMRDSGSDTLASIMQLDDDLMFVHLTHLLFPAEYLDFCHVKFNRFVTFEPEPEAPKLVGLTLRPPLSPLPVAQSKPIAPPEPVHLIPDSSPRNHTDNFTLSSTLSRPEPVPDFSMDPETLLNYNKVIQFLLSAPEFRFKDSKLETLFWIRAQGRYMKYLSLLKLSIGKRVDPPVAPLDVLMLWMVHMLDTHRYIEDVIRLFDGEIKMLSFEFPIALLVCICIRYFKIGHPSNRTRTD